jgi:tRNA (guanine26-N2/guanine27-N2)-dimethyltransferase
MPTQLVMEGATKLEVPELERFRTPAGDYAPSLTRVFYNPLMELCRDISVSVAQVLADDLGAIRICDPLAGVGARGLRYAREVKGVSKVVVNDRSSDALEFIRRNVALNDLADLVEVRNEDANALLWSYRPKFHVVDLDPFGSPAPFVDAACGAIVRGGILMLTATDTAPLCGTFPRTCLRRYGARPLRTEYCHELGVRILIGFCQRAGGRRELALAPLFAHSTMHYFRIYLRASAGARRVDELMAQQGYVSHCFSCGRRVISEGIAAELPSSCECGERLAHAGPMWLGRLVDGKFVGRVAADLASRRLRLGEDALELLNRLVEEGEGPPTFYDVHELAKSAGTSPPKLAKLLEELRGRGYFASRTHFSPLGLRTDAPIDEVLRSLKEISKPR